LTILIFFVLIQLPLSGQLSLTRQGAVDSALAKNPQVVASLKFVSQEKAARAGSAYFDKTEVWFESPTSYFFAVGIQQNIQFPGVYVNDYRYKKQAVNLAEKEVEVNKNKIAKNTELLYLNLQYSIARRSLLLYQDSLYGSILRATNKRYSVGDAAYLEKVLEETRQREIENWLQQAHRDIEIFKQQLLLTTGITADSLITEKFIPYENANQVSDTSIVARNPLAAYYVSNITLSRYNFRLQRSLVYPNIFLGYLNQGFRNSEILYRFRFGIGVPLLLTNYTSRIRSARIGIDVAEFRYRSVLTNLKVEYIQIYGNWKKSQDNLRYYEQTGLKQSDEIIRSSTILFKAGEITYFAYLQGLSQALALKMAHLEALKNYNAAIVELKYITGQ
jgi:cobalt-zinc-cadmium resistance protein CzcA